MSTPYIGEIRTFGFNFAPYNWAFCDGQIIAISQNTALFSILGTTFGGNGTTTFGLPNMQGNAPMHWGNGPGLTPRTLGEQLGSASVTLTAQQLPAHNHMAIGGTAGGSQQVAKITPQAELSSGNPGQIYSTTITPQVAFSPKAIGVSGQSQPHNNLQPLQAVNFCIALYGVFPSRN